MTVTSEWGWRPEVVIKANTSTIKEDVVLLVRAGRLVELSWGRNAWHSTWVTQYNRNSVFFPDMSSAKEAAERRRVQGTVFYIRHLPVLAFLGTYSTMVLADVHASEPFSAWRPFDAYGAQGRKLTPLTSFADVLSMLRERARWQGPPRVEHALVPVQIRGVDRQGVAQEADAYRHYKSRAVGGRPRLLEWPELSAGVSDASVQSLAAQYSEGSALDHISAACEQRNEPLTTELIERAFRIDSALNALRSGSYPQRGVVAAACSCSDDEKRTPDHDARRLLFPRVVRDGTTFQAVRCNLEYQAHLDLQRHRMDMRRDKAAPQ